MTIELDTTLAQAEVLFLSFAQIVADIDRRKAEDGEGSSGGLRHRGSRGKEQQDKVSLSRIELSEDLRNLLKTN
jgi:hypothetical protein